MECKTLTLKHILKPLLPPILRPLQPLHKHILVCSSLILVGVCSTRCALWHQATMDMALLLAMPLLLLIHTKLRDCISLLFLLNHDDVQHIAYFPVGFFARSVDSIGRIRDLILKISEHSTDRGHSRSAACLSLERAISLDQSIH